MSLHVVDLGRVTGGPGPQGPQGVQGEQGITPSIQVGEVTTLPYGSRASVTRRAGSPDSAPVLDFALPGGMDSPGVPRGVIAMWSGAAEVIPFGWLLCDGTNGTPDLRDRFIVGAGSGYRAGDTGGAAAVALTEEELAAHSHGASVEVSGLSVQSAGEHTHGYVDYAMSAFSRDEFWGANVGDGYSHASTIPYDRVSASAGAHTHSISGTATATLESAGEGQAHENRPPYYALCFIMKE